MNTPSTKSNFTAFRIGAVALAAVAAITLLFTLPQIFQNVDAGEIVVIQDPFDGQLHVYTEPGYKLQAFGKVTTYPRRGNYTFSSPRHGSNDVDTSKKLRFNDGGHGNLSGGVSYEMPTDEKSIIEIHRDFRSQEGVERDAVAKMIDAAVYLAGPLMSSTESSGERRAELVQYINDQAENGVYVTKADQVRTHDQLTGADKTVLVTSIVYDQKTGLPKRQQGSILEEYNIRLLPLSITELRYDEVVEEQIKRRQQATTEVQIAQANARKAEQDAITIAKQGEAEATKTKWEQEAINAREIAEAEKKVRVAAELAKEAELLKRQQILLGEGEAERKRLVMNADGALEKKLATYLKAQEYWAAAVAKYQGNWVPQVQMGGTTGNVNGTNGAQDLIDMLSVKTAKDLALDLSVKGQSNTSK